MAGWLTASRTEAAADRILDAAARLFAERDPGSVGMHEIAAESGCSRATLYRYFENRDTLYAGYVQRWAGQIGRELAERLADIDDPQQRLVTGITEAMAAVRRNPALLCWFSAANPPIGGTQADRSEAVTAMVARFLATLGPDDAEALQRRARWLVRVVTSLLMFPGHGDTDERTLLEEFVVPVVTPSRKKSASRRP